MTEYGAKEVAQLFGLTVEGVRKYAIEFRDYLSPTADPGENQKRLFTDEDLAVFALIVELRKRGKHYEDMHAALKSGQRGTPPENPTAIIETGNSPLVALQAKYDALQAAYFELKESNTREIGIRDGEIKALNKELEQLRSQVADNINLHKKIAVLEYQLEELRKQKGGGE